MNNQKKTKKGNVKNSNSGITLIALVVTIIVLLILAGISISMLSGDNSILQRATDAKTRSDEAQIQERIKLAYHSALVGGKGSYTKDTLMQELKNEFETDYDVDDSNDEKWKMKAHGQEVEIPAGTKEQEDTNKVYTLGQEVSIGRANFFVITENDSANNDKITLISKYCLNTDNNVQNSNVYESGRKAQSCAFIQNSDSVFWDESKGYPQDVNDYDGSEGSALYFAQEYGKQKGRNWKINYKI